MRSYHELGMQVARVHAPRIIIIDERGQALTFAAGQRRKPRLCGRALTFTNAATSRRCSTLVNDMVAAIDVKRLARDEPRCVVCKKGRGDPHVVDADEAAGRRLRLRLIEQHIEFGNS